VGAGVAAGRDRCPVAVVAVVGLLIVGCTDGGRSMAGNSSSGGSNAASTVSGSGAIPYPLTADADTDTVVQVSLTDAGSEPRQRLRYGFEPGRTVAYLRTASTTRTSESRPAGYSLSSRATQRCTNASTGSRLGSVTVETVDVSVAAGLNSTPDDVQGETSGLMIAPEVLTVTPLGHVARVQTIGPGGEPGPELARDETIRVGETVVAFPVDAVGVGATWTQVSQSSVQSLLTETRQTYSVMALTRDNVTLRFDGASTSTGASGSAPSSVTRDSSGTLIVAFDCVVAAGDTTVTRRTDIDSHVSTRTDNVHIAPL
jgi:hypothetical protein